MSDKENSAPSTTPSASSSEDAINQIMQLSSELDAIRKRQFYVSLLGVVLILAFLITFFMNLVTFGKNFDRKALTDQMLSQTSDLSRDQEVLLIQKDFQQVFVPELQKAFQEKINSRLPSIQEAVDKESDAFMNYVQNDVKDRVLKRVRASFEGMEKRLVAKHGKNAPSPEELGSALKEMEELVISDLTNSMDSRLDKAQESLASLNESCEKFKELPEYKTMESFTQSDVENRLIESFLELWIYYLNPARGEAGNLSIGGI